MKKINNIPVYNNTPEDLKKYISAENFIEFYDACENLIGKDLHSFLTKSHASGDFSNNNPIMNEVEFIIRSSELAPAIKGYVAYYLGEEGDEGLTGYVPLYEQLN